MPYNLRVMIGFNESQMAKYTAHTKVKQISEVLVYKPPP